MGTLINSILSRLEVLTDLVEFAEERMEAGSTYTAGWCNAQQYSEWLITIAQLRDALPKEEVEKFDAARYAKGVRYLQEDGP